MKRTLEEWRNIRKMSQAELAEAIGMTQVTISKWENGHTSPKMRDIEKLKQALSLKPQDSIIMP